MGMTKKPIEIYCITNTVTGKRYVGQTCTGVRNRWNKHAWLALTKNVNTRFYESIRKHGKSAFKTSVLQSCDSLEEANQAEKRWVAELMTTNQSFGYNMTEGGDQQQAGWIMGAEAREKIAASKRGKPLTARTVKTDEAHQPIVEAFKRLNARELVAQELGVSRGHVTKVLLRWKRLHDPDLKVGPEHHGNAVGQALIRRADIANSKIFEMFDSGHSRGEIAHELDVSYGHVKMVINRRKRRNFYPPIQPKQSSVSLDDLLEP